MKAAAQSPSFEAFLEFLDDQADEVYAHCKEVRDESVGASAASGERARLAADLAMRPYLRWLAAWSEQALICGRNHQCLDIARKALAEDSHDKAGVRFTMAFAFAKLEDRQGLDELVACGPAAGRTRPADDPWTLLAYLALAYKFLDYDAAGAALDSLLAIYPHAAEALLRQIELPDGVFARLAVMPYSEDELILAISEGTVLLQEGFDPQGKGTLGSWVMHETVCRKPHAVLSVMGDQQKGWPEHGVEPGGGR